MNKIDLFKYLVDGSNAYTLETIAFNMAMTTVIALFLYFIYKKTFNGVLYSQSFNVSLVIIAMTTAMIIMLIGSNLAISLGMVGALSIVRFRSAIKEPRDLAFLFWSIAIGLASGTGAFLIAVAGSIFIGFMLLVFKKSIYLDNCYLLIIKGENIAANTVVEILKLYDTKNKLRLHSINNNFTEITFDVFLKKQNGSVIIEHLKGTPDIGEVNLVSFNGEITG